MRRQPSCFWKLFPGFTADCGFFKDSISMVGNSFYIDPDKNMGRSALRHQYSAVICRLSSIYLLLCSTTENLTEIFHICLSRYKKQPDQERVRLSVILHWGLCGTDPPVLQCRPCLLLLNGWFQQNTWYPCRIPNALS